MRSAAPDILRINLPSREEFDKIHIRPRMPVVITNLFEKDLIRQVATKADALLAFPKIHLDVGSEYITSYINSPGGREIFNVTFSDYWSIANSRPELQLLCTEQEVPAGVMKLFNLPNFFLNMEGRNDNQGEIFSLAPKYGDHDLLSNAFVARQGSRAHLHYDGDQRHVLLYQIFGRKEVILFPPSAGTRLDTSALVMAFAGTCLHELSTESISDILLSCGGYRTILEPGEAIYMPKLWWHFVSYIDDGMSINFRFGRDALGRFMNVDNFHRDYFVQNYCEHYDSSGVPPEDIEEIKLIYTENISINAKIGRVRNALRRFLRRDSRDDDVICYDNMRPDSLDIPMILRENSGSFIYTPPSMLASMRLTGRMNDAQLRQIHTVSGKLGYSQADISHLAWNRFGKHLYQNMSKAEASHLLSYLRSTGANLA